MSAAYGLSRLETPRATPWVPWDTGGQVWALTPGLLESDEGPGLSRGESAFSLPHSSVSGGEQWYLPAEWFVGTKRRQSTGPTRKTWIEGSGAQGREPRVPQLCVETGWELHFCQTNVSLAEWPRQTG